MCTFELGVFVVRYSSNVFYLILAVLKLFASALGNTGLSRTSAFQDITTQGTCCNKMIVETMCIVCPMSSLTLI